MKELIFTVIKTERISYEKEADKRYSRSFHKSATLEEIINWAISINEDVEFTDLEISEYKN